MVDYTGCAVCRKEMMYVKIRGCSDKEITELFRLSQVAGTRVADYGRSSVLLESVQSEEQNEELIARLKRDYPGRIEIVRGGSVAAEAINQEDC